MDKLINKHPVKIQIATAATVLLSIFWFGAQVAAFVSTAEANFKRLDEVEVKANLVPILQANYETMKNDIGEIKGDVKYLIKLNK